MVRATSIKFLILAICALASAQSDPIVKSPRLRYVDPNGARVLAERVAGSARVSIQLFQSSRGLDPGIEAAGWRHMLEHLSAKGAKRDIDQRLESVGGLLTASTLRDATRFEIEIPADSLDVGLSVLRDLLAPRTYTRVEIDSEQRILAQELSLVSAERAPFRAAWAMAYGDARPDPIGTIAGFASISPSGLTILDRQLKATGRVTVSVAGRIEVDAIVEKVRDIIGSLESQDSSGLATPPPKESARGTRDFRAAKANAWADRKTWARFVAAQALRTVDDRLSVTYTPAVKEGLIVVTSEALEGWPDLKERVLESRDVAIADARLLAIRWLRSSLSGASNVASMRGYLLSQDTRATPEQAMEVVESLTDGEITRELDAWLAAPSGSVIP